MILKVFADTIGRKDKSGSGQFGFLENSPRRDLEAEMSRPDVEKKYLSKLTVSA
jgi:hypothetical protein